MLCGGKPRRPNRLWNRTAVLEILGGSSNVPSARIPVGVIMADSIISRPLTTVGVMQRVIGP